MKTLSGIFPPVTTPFDPEGRLLTERFTENLRKWSDAPLAGLTVAGSNGESPYLTDEEKLSLLREARRTLPSARTLIVGAGRESTRLCVEFIRKISDHGADYALVGTPCYFKAAMTDDALLAHFWQVADNSPIPLLVYNVPQFTGVQTSANLIERLSAHENIAGMKDSSGNLAFQAEVRRRTPSRFHILVGSAPTLFPSLVQGAIGGIVAIGCALPEMTAELYEAWRTDDWKRAAKIQSRLSAPAAAVTTQYGVPGLKAALDLMGFFGGHPRLPLLPLGEKKRADLRSIFEQAGVLRPADRT
jgi:4-hydroxy-2-oxoglutarate aldolase